MLDPQTITTLVVGVIVAVLGFLYRTWKPLDPVKSWLEMLLSIVGALVVALVLGKFAGAINLADPVKAIQFFLENASILFVIVQVIYSAVKQAMPENPAVVKAFGK